LATTSGAESAHKGVDQRSRGEDFGRELWKIQGGFYRRAGGDAAGWSTLLGTPQSVGVSCYEGLRNKATRGYSQQISMEGTARWLARGRKGLPGKTIPLFLH
jgi:hypothetical protein